MGRRTQYSIHCLGGNKYAYQIDEQVGGGSWWYVCAAASSAKTNTHKSVKERGILHSRLQKRGSSHLLLSSIGLIYICGTNANKKSRQPK